MLDLLILYGSQSGNCEDLSKRIGRQAISLGLQVDVLECDHFHFCKLIDQKLVLFICSTTGVGDEPDNMKNFWKFIRRKDLPKDSLSSVYISVIGLGDSSYEYYNFIAKKLFNRLVDLGAKPLAQLVLGDEQHECGPNAAIDPWLQTFWTQMIKVFGLDVDQTLLEESDQLFSPSFRMKFISNGDSDDKCLNSSLNVCDDDNQRGSEHFDQSHPYMARVVDNKRITAEDHEQDVRLIKLGIDCHQLNYASGDVCYVKPQNRSENVQKFISLLNLKADLKFILEKGEHCWMSPSSYYNHLPKPCSLETLITEYMDIQSVPKRSFFDLLYRFSQSDLERQKLKDFAKKSDSDDLYEYCNRPKRNIVEVLSDFPNTTTHIKIEYLFDLIPALSPRPFSIASSSSLFANEVHLVMAVVRYQTRLKQPRLGLCSNWLADLLPSNAPKVPIHIRKGSFRLAPDSVPYIMVGPGTGVAPFRAFIQERVHRNINDNYLFFGCRYSKCDFYLEDEWKEFESSGHLEYFVAFSRDGPQKVYVQNKIYEQKQLIYKLLTQNNAYVYISGSANQMPQQVREAICDVISDQSNQSEQPLDKKQIEAIVKAMETKGRIQYECWS